MSRKGSRSTNEKKSEHFLVTSNQQPVGTGRLRIKDSYVKFERIATLNSMRGFGVGKMLMSSMIKYAIKNYPEYLPAMHAQKTAWGFYEKLGWIGVGDEFFEAQIPHRLMIFRYKDSFNKIRDTRYEI